MQLMIIIFVEKEVCYPLFLIAKLPCLTTIPSFHPDEFW